MTNCPFKNEECTQECALYISPDELNELVVAKLTSLGTLKREIGICALKHLGLTAGRFLFENSTTNSKRF